MPKGGSLAHAVVIALAALAALAVIFVIFRQIVLEKSPFGEESKRTVKIVEAINYNLIVLNTGNAETSTGLLFVYVDNIKTSCKWGKEKIEPGKSDLCTLVTRCFSGSQVKVAGPENIDTFQCR